MSFLFRAVLGDRVVHPPPKHKTANGELGGADPAAGDVLTSSNPHRSSDMAAAVNGGGDGRVVVSRDLSSLAPAIKQHHKDNSSGAGNASTTPPLPLPRASNRADVQHRPPTRTLLVRSQTCTVAQDLRDALRELEEKCGDLPYVMGAREVLHFVELARTHADDDGVVGSAMHILSTATDVAAFPTYSDGTYDDDGDNGEDAEARERRLKKMKAQGVYAVSEKEKRQIRNSFLHELVAEVPYFVALLKRGGRAVDSRDGGSSGPAFAASSTAAFWVCLHSVQLLTRLEEYNPAEVDRLLLSSQGLGALIDLLVDAERDGPLRNAALSLVTSLTATNSDLQTLFAFENGFDSLFQVVEAEGGVLEGGVIVSECLSTVHNMLRGNKATQKLFIEMGCARHLAPLLAALPAQLSQRFRGRDSDTTAYEPPTNMQCLITLAVVGILSCILREADEAHSEGAGKDADPGHHGKAGGARPSCPVRDNLVQCGVLRPLASLALCGAAVDDATRIGALRALGSVLRRSKTAAVEFLTGDAGAASRLSAPASTAVTTLVRAEAPPQAAVWSPTRAVLQYVFVTGDKALLGASVELVAALIEKAQESAECQVALTREMLSGFGPRAGISGFTAGNQATAAHESGAALGLALTGPTPHPSGKLFAARLLARLVTFPGVADEVTRTHWTVAGSPSANGNNNNNNRSMGDGRPATHSLPTIAAVTLSPAMSPNFFNAFVAYLLFCFSGGHGSQQMDTGALGSYTYALLVWLREEPHNALALLRDPQLFGKLLQIAGGGGGQVNVRFWCATIAAYLCCLAPRQGQSIGAGGGNGGGGDRSANLSSPPPPTRQALMGQFINSLGGAVVLDNLLFDVQASTPQWSQPVADAFSSAAASRSSGGSVIYDEAFVQLLKSIVEEFKSISPAPAATGTTAAGPAETSDYPRFENESAQMNSHSPNGQQFSHPHHAGATGFDAAGAAAHAELAEKDEQCRRMAEELEQLRVQVAAQQATITSLQEENEHLRGELEDTRRELLTTRDAAAAAGHDTAHAVETPDSHGLGHHHQHGVSEAAVQEMQSRHRQEADDLRENVRLLEEALNSKDEEHVQLVNTLNAMEAQLQQLGQQQHQQQQQQQLLSHPQHISPPQRRPSVDAVAQTELSGDVTASQQEETVVSSAGNGGAPLIDEQESWALQQRLLEAANDRDELLIMVAELNDECESIRAVSGFPTPAHGQIPSGFDMPEASEPAAYEMQQPQQQYGHPTDEHTGPDANRELFYQQQQQQQQQQYEHLPPPPPQQQPQQQEQQHQQQGEYLQQEAAYYMPETEGEKFYGGEGDVFGVASQQMQGEPFCSGVAANNPFGAQQSTQPDEGQWYSEEHVAVVPPPPPPHPMMIHQQQQQPQQQQQQELSATPVFTSDPATAHQNSNRQPMTSPHRDGMTAEQPQEEQQDGGEMYPSGTFHIDLNKLHVDPKAAITQDGFWATPAQPPAPQEQQHMEERQPMHLVPQAPQQTIPNDAHTHGDSTDAAPMGSAVDLPRTPQEVSYAAPARLAENEREEGEHIAVAAPEDGVAGGMMCGHLGNSNANPFYAPQADFHNQGVAVIDDGDDSTAGGPGDGGVPDLFAATDVQWATVGQTPSPASDVHPGGAFAHPDVPVVDATTYSSNNNPFAGDAAGAGNNNNNNAFFPGSEAAGGAATQDGDADFFDLR